MKINVAVDRGRRAVEFAAALHMDARTREVDGEIAVAQIAIERDLGDRGAGERRLCGVIDLIELKIVEQRQLKVQLSLGFAADARRVEPDFVRIMKWFGVE